MTRARRPLAPLLAVMVLLTPTAAAQRYPPTLHPRDRLRITTVDTTRLLARVVSDTGWALRVVTEAGPLLVPWSDVLRLERRHEASPVPMARRGAGLGAAVGLAFAIVTVSRTSCSDLSCLAFPLVGVVLAIGPLGGAGVGFVAGWIVGTAFPEEYWQTLYRHRPGSPHLLVGRQFSLP